MLIVFYLFCLVFRLQDLFEKNHDVIIEEEGVSKLGKNYNQTSEVCVIAVKPLKFIFSIQVYHFSLMAFLMLVDLLKVNLIRK